jgi:hypothetical protein
MGGLDWVQVDVGFPMSLAVVCAARTLGMERQAFLGAMVELQIWAVQALPSGRFEPFPASGGRSPDASADEAVWQEAVESAVRWTGASGAFWDALLRTGILVREGDSVRLTLADRYVQVLEQREKEAERKRRERAARASGASAGRPSDAPGTSSPRRRREKESEKKSSPAAAGEVGMPGGRLAPVSPLPDEEPSTDDAPVQLALPGTHIVPASPPREVWRQSVATAALAPPTPDEPVSRESPAPESTRARAAAFFRACQAERGRVIPGLPAEEQPKGWASWYSSALRKVGGDEQRLQQAWRGYLHSDWGRTREPRCTAEAFCTPRVWGRYLEPLQHEEPPGASGPPSVDVSTEAGRRWQECLSWLQDHGKRYALTWLARARPMDVEDEHLVLAVPDLYFRQWVQEHYGEMVDLLVRKHGLAGVRWLLAESSEQQRTADTGTHPSVR